MSEEQSVGDAKPVNLEITKQLVIFNLGDKETAVDLVDVKNLFSEIENYNRRFSPGVIMGRFVSENVNKLKEIDITDIKDNQKAIVPSMLSKEKEDQEMSASVAFLVHKSLLEKIGLSFEPLSGKSAMFMARGEGGEKVGQGEMRVNISDKFRFLSFLGAIDFEKIKKGNLQPGLENLSKIFCQQIVDNYDFKKPNDETLELFGGLEKIVEEYKRLKMTESAGKLETYLNYAKQGNLREFIAIEKKGLLSEPGKGFGPADWQSDSTPEGLEKRWNEAINILKMAKTNEKAQILCKDLQVHLLKCVNIAKAKVNFQENFLPEKKKRFNEILENTYFQLEDINTF